MSMLKGEGYWNGEHEDNFNFLLCLSSGLIYQDHMLHGAFATKECKNLLL